MHLIVKERKLWCSKRNNHHPPPHTYLMGGVQLFSSLKPVNFMMRHAIVTHLCFSYAEACISCHTITRKHDGLYTVCYCLKSCDLALLNRLDVYCNTL